MSFKPNNTGSSEFNFTIDELNEVYSNYENSLSEDVALGCWIAKRLNDIDDVGVFSIMGNTVRDVVKQGGVDNYIEYMKKNFPVVRQTTTLPESK